MLLFRNAFCSVLLLTSACAADVASPDEIVVELDGEGKADDLVGRNITITLDGQMQRVAVGDYVTTPLTVDERSDGITLTTGDIRLNESFENIRARVPGNQTGNAGDFAAAFALQVKRPDGSWELVEPIADDAAYFWEHATARREGSELVIFGRANKVEDLKFGLTRNFLLREATVRVQGEISDVRFLVVPTWNFWDWDSTGYVARIEFTRAE